MMGHARRNKDGDLVRKGGLCAKAGVERFGFHDIRKTVSVYLNDVEKAGIKRIQRFLRNRRQTTIEIYIDGDFSESKIVADFLNRGTEEAVKKALNREDGQAARQEP